MKNVFLALVLASFSAPAFAAANTTVKAETTVATTKTPVTGTVVTTKKSKHSVKHGKEIAKLETTETTKTKTNGAVEKKVEVKGESEKAPAKK